MKIKILRQRSPFDSPYWESFIYDGPTDTTIAGMIDHLNYNDDIVNDKGEHTGRIGWECSCLQAACGSCAMVINGRPALACETFLRDLKGDEIVIRPLRKFPVISDLVVDRSAISKSLLNTNAYIGNYDPLPGEDHELQYLAAKCLKCGLCLEVCPNYVSGKEFFGGLFANDCYLIYTRNRSRSEEIKNEYDKHFGRICSKSLSCMDVCPAGIPSIAIMARMNRRK